MAITRQSLNQKTVEQLRELCTQRGLSTTGRSTVRRKEEGSTRDVLSSAFEGFLSYSVSMLGLKAALIERILQHEQALQVSLYSDVIPGCMCVTHNVF